jgi:sec-independent protein translocase protein TatA
MILKGGTRGRRVLALDPLELGVIAVMALVLFIWGPQKIPEVARMIGRARREFEDASKEIRNITNSMVPQVESGTAAKALRSLTETPPPPQTSIRSGDQILIDTARKLGIATQGKTREQIQEEIVATAQSRDPKTTNSG